MSRPRTPVSACPLTRLEVRDGMQTSVYEAGQFVGGMTLTLDCQRSRDTGRDSLVLLVHCALREMLSIRISDLLRDPRRVTDAVTADRAALRLAVSVPAQHHEILATFQDARDFSLSACMLSKSGFAIKDEAAQREPRHFSTPPHEQLPHHQPGVNLGPRLSSVTPIPGLSMDHGPEAHGGWAFASLLNSNTLPSFPLQTPLSAGPTRRATPEQDGFTSPLVNNSPDAFQRRVTSDEASQLLNPYNLFLGKHSGDLHRPRVSSPLRNSFSPEGPVTPEWGPRTYPAEVNRNEPSARHPLILRSKSSSEWRAHGDHRKLGTPPSPQSRDSPTDPMRGGTPPTMFEKEQGQASQAASSFRDHMPQRRDLPFAQDKARVPRRSSSAGSGNSRDENYQQPFSPQGLEDDQIELGKAHQDRQDKSRRTTSLPCVDDKPPPESANSADQSSPNLGEAESTYQSLGNPKQAVSSQPSYFVQPAVVVADPLVIRQLNSMTLWLLEQYQADVSRGCDEGVCAQFYVERMQSCRREFWLSQLMGVMRQGMT
ncbi:hypothetical protein HRG_010403 [Hirsutella rhossiliensis]|uniref:Uncharacterized protein n=1 Tax=Hirsutella rhossiliensis TaxID=111463 RepID=A0A9P8SF70_9HYPO|nr:uncharacterized protein HRG_10403 [Hirsutella rhossiliensis]KAH0958716.1 hypothetical protein HRG_10403 [Hirsutella rhossiliensis]